MRRTVLTVLLIVMMRCDHSTEQVENDDVAVASWWFLSEDSSLPIAHALESQQCSERQRWQRGTAQLKGLSWHLEEGGPRNEGRLTRGFLAANCARFGKPAVLGTPWAAGGASAQRLPWHPGEGGAEVRIQNRK